jgi:RimJ/RimL family protein N-acetyltransferase
MKYDAKTITLKNGQSCLLKSPSGDDAEEILQHLKQTSGETSNMARYENEITISVDEERVFLSKRIDHPKAIMISAVMDGEIVASAGFAPVAPYEKYQHRAEFGISIKRSFWNRGIGTAVMSAIVESAKNAGFEQLELEVVTCNERAIALYKKMGFEIYGMREKSFKYRDGGYDAEYLMLLKL